MLPLFASHACKTPKSHMPVLCGLQQDPQSAFEFSACIDRHVYDKSDAYVRFRESLIGYHPHFIFLNARYLGWSAWQEVIDVIKMAEYVCESHWNMEKLATSLFLLDRCSDYRSIMSRGWRIAWWTDSIIFGGGAIIVSEDDWMRTGI